ncbi:Transposon Ty3-G Gag-Pol poly [Brachionus plicatilis]|uniref:Transposon Ty3-G Gag-Pol poly n=1 Tax=Brachionus plicatilis TaxID=10195 RepID=A0A3M7SN17_BRAPC|nr:Transposon Ty3-G Gag-Pol poly [Brachionus plicatilis]
MECYSQFRFHFHLRLCVWIFLVHLRGLKKNVFVDLSTNWVEACPLCTLEAEVGAIKFYSVIITRHGCPRKKFSINKLESSSKHPQTYGKTERFNKFLTNALAMLVKECQNNWDELTDDILLANRVTIIMTIKETPFFLLYGRVSNQLIKSINQLIKLLVANCLLGDEYEYNTSIEDNNKTKMVEEIVFLL